MSPAPLQPEMLTSLRDFEVDDADEEAEPSMAEEGS
jgi:hypothetical protein